MTDRIRNKALLSKVTTAEQAALLVEDGMTIGASGFSGIGGPKVFPAAVAARAEKEKLRISIVGGASLGDEFDGVFARAGIVDRKIPFMNNKDMRARANANQMHFIDMHLSQVPYYLKNGYFGKIDIGVVEATAITEEGNIIPTLAVGLINEVVAAAEKLVVEVNVASPAELEGLHDIYTVKRMPYTEPIPITKAWDRIGTPYVPCDPDKIAAIIVTNKPDSAKTMKAPDAETQAIAANIIGFLKDEMAAGRLPNPLPPLQSGFGNVSNAVLEEFSKSDFKDLVMYSEVMQDSVAKLIMAGTVKSACGASLVLSADFHDEFLARVAEFRDQIILRPQEISNSPEVIHRLGVIAMNTALEVDLAGCVNSTHVNGVKIMNGIGGSGDYSRNAGLSIFSTQSTAKNGTVSCIVPTVSHVDHTDHDTMIIVTEQGVADLRYKDAFERAELMIENCAHPKFRPALRRYLEDAMRDQNKHFLPPMPNMKLEASET